MTSASPADWSDLLDRFRALGGVFDNLELRHGPRGRGLFARNPEQAVRLFVPRHLLIPSAHIVVRAGHPVLAETTGLHPDVPGFFEDYHRATSWTGGGAEQTRNFLTGLADLPVAAREILSRDFGLAPWFLPVNEAQVLDQFLRARRLTLDGQMDVAPVLELANYDAEGPGLDVTEAGIALAGHFAGEVSWRYRIADSFQMFGLYQVLSSERFAFSLPFSVSDRALGLTIRVGTDTARAVAPEMDPGLPVVVRTGDRLEVAFLLLADQRDPRTPYRAFQHSLAPHLGAGAPAFFQGLLFSNRRLFLRLLSTLEAETTPVAVQLRQMCRMQLEALCAVSLL